METKSRFNIRRKVLLILYAVLSLALIGNFVISGQIFESFQVKAFNNEAFATARGLQTNINSLIAKSFLPYTDIVNCEPLLEDFVESNEQVLYTYTTDVKGALLYKSHQVVGNGIDSALLETYVMQGQEKCIDDKQKGILYYILPLQEEIEVDDKEVLSPVGVLVVAYPRTCITEPLVKLYINNAILAAITFSLSFSLIFLFLTKWITKPLQMLDEAIRKVEKTGFERNNLDIKANDEIGQITRSFNDMLGKLAVTTVSKEYVDSILLNMSEALFVIDLDMRIEKVNDAALKLLGYEQKEIQGQPMDQLYIRMIDDPYAKENIQNLFEQDSLRNNEIEFVNKAGNSISVSINWSAIKDDKGRICKYVCTARDITELKKAQSIVMYQANYDQLTGLSNRYNLEKCIEKVLNDTTKNHFFIEIDLDRFKVVNDTCGHAAGDELLKQIAYMLKSVVGDMNTVARLGGDEFAIIMYNTDRCQMIALMDNLLQENQRFNFIWEGKSFQVGMSIGAFEICQAGLERMTVLAAADRACYIAKMNGGNRLHVYTEADKELGDGAEEISMISILIDAFESNRFFLQYQPILSACDSTAIKGYEVLLRLRTKDGMVLEPGAFLSTAERYHKLYELNQYMIHEFCKTYFEQKDKLGFGQAVQFQMSIYHETIHAEQFCDFVENEIREYKIPRGTICFEVSEGDIVANFVETAALANRLTELGCRLAINHVGCGMPSSAYLKKITVDSIKISDALIRSMADSLIDKAFVKSIHEIAGLLNVQTVAEGVDTLVVLQKVQELGIDFVQGNQIMKPGSFEEIVR